MSGYGTCSGCDQFTFVVGRLCLTCRHIEEEARVKTECTCDGALIEGVNGLSEFRITRLDSACPTHGWEV